MSGEEIFGYGWREDHARAGDAALVEAQKLMDEGTIKSQGHATIVAATIGAYAAIAQAHYAAANIRTRPIRDVGLPMRVPEFDPMSRPDNWFTTGPWRGGCVIARLDHASPPYGPQCKLAKDHDGDHVFPA